MVAELRMRLVERGGGVVEDDHPEAAGLEATAGDSDDLLELVETPPETSGRRLHSSEIHIRPRSTPPPGLREPRNPEMRPPLPLAVPLELVETEPVARVTTSAVSPASPSAQPVASSPGVLATSPPLLPAAQRSPADVGCSSSQPPAVGTLTVARGETCALEASGGALRLSDHEAAWGHATVAIPMATLPRLMRAHAAALRLRGDGESGAPLTAPPQAPLDVSPQAPLDAPLAALSPPDLLELLAPLASLVRGVDYAVAADADDEPTGWLVLKDATRLRALTSLPPGLVLDACVGRASRWRRVARAAYFLQRTLARRWRARQRARQQQHATVRLQSSWRQQLARRRARARRKARQQLAAAASSAPPIPPLPLPRRPALPEAEAAALRGVSDDELRGAERTFARFDVDGDGVISFADFASAMARLEPATAHSGGAALRAMFDAVDVDGDGAVHFAEFVLMQLRKGDLSAPHPRSRSTTAPAPSDATGPLLAPRQQRPPAGGGGCGASGRGGGGMAGGGMAGGSLARGGHGQYAAAVLSTYELAQPGGDYRLAAEGFVALMEAVGHHQGCVLPREQLLQIFEAARTESSPTIDLRSLLGMPSVVRYFAEAHERAHARIAAAQAAQAAAAQSHMYAQALAAAYGLPPGHWPYHGMHAPLPPGSLPPGSLSPGSLPPGSLPGSSELPSSLNSPSQTPVRGPMALPRPAQCGGDGAAGEAPPPPARAHPSLKLVHAKQPPVAASKHSARPRGAADGEYRATSADLARPPARRSASASAACASSCGRASANSTPDSSTQGASSSSPMDAMPTFAMRAAAAALMVPTNGPANASSDQRRAPKAGRAALERR